VQPIVVFRQAMIAHFAVTKDLLNVSERVFPCVPSDYGKFGLKIIPIKCVRYICGFEDLPRNIIAKTRTRTKNTPLQAIPFSINSE
jgi:hypothetical protein